MKKYKLIALIGLFLALIGCENKTGSDPGKFQVVSTVGMIADLAEVIGGDHIEVNTIIGAGADPHVYKHTAADMKSVGAADLVFYNGYHLEGKFGTVLEKLSSKGNPVHAVAEAVVKKESLLMDEEGAEDPHLWMDVSQWRKVAKYIQETLTKELPDHSSDFETNFNDLDSKLETLDAYAKEKLATIPENQRHLITAHDAFGYMESAYGLKVRGIQGISTESKAGLKDLENLITFLVENKIPAVFTESSVNDKGIRALIEGAAAKGLTVAKGGELHSDAMGTAGTYEGTYLGMIDHNITTITNALGGSAPAGGCFGKLSK